MSHGKTRENKNCLNCDHIVEERFCPHCGQENTETRQPFHYLFTHFVEDFTHYDGQFWKTFKYLLTRPGKLTKEYLAGKKQLYVAPVKLYIFVSFVAFLVPALLPKSKEAEANQVAAKERKFKIEEERVIKTLNKGGLISDEDTKEELERISKEKKDLDKNESTISFSDSSSVSTSKGVFFDAKNIKEFDSLALLPQNSEFWYARPAAKKFFEFKEQNLTKDEINKRIADTFFKTLPKALFVYMPIFAFFLWIFHNKKKWWYFDHGIFTLHYFSFLLLSTLIFNLFGKFLDLFPDWGALSILSIVIFLAMAIYISVYFFIAHYRVYENKKSISILKSTVLFIINFVCLVLMFIFLIYISFLMAH